MALVQEGTESGCDVAVPPQVVASKNSSSRTILQLCWGSVACGGVFCNDGGLVYGTLGDRSFQKLERPDGDPLATQLGSRTGMLLEYEVLHRKCPQRRWVSVTVWCDLRDSRLGDPLSPFRVVSMAEDQCQAFVVLASRMGCPRRPRVPPDPNTGSTTVVEASPAPRARRSLWLFVALGALVGIFCCAVCISGMVLVLRAVFRRRIREHAYSRVDALEEELSEGYLSEQNPHLSSSPVPPSSD
jgi:hypothetical protein